MARFRIAILKGFAPAALALVLVAGATGGVFAAPGQIHVVKSAGAALRAAPSTKAEVIGRLVGGDRVMEFEIRGGWLRVQQMGRVAPEGWVSAVLVEPEPRLPVVKAPPQPEYAPRRPVRWRYADDYYVVYPRFHRRHLRRHKKRIHHRILRRHKKRIHHRSVRRHKKRGHGVRPARRSNRTFRRTGVSIRHGQNYRWLGRYR
ncbi:MAG: SH3 domain-containing protein [Alphaproteobacteria bacterium]|nr:SH3 domain-containing protein [Alphaproteobacteria bacterium]